MIQASLSASQQRVVAHDEGALLVVAGPGSGKTRVLTERVRRLLTGRRGHFRVLALTFTIKAAKEMEDRLADLGEARRRATISTVHGFCLEMLADRGKSVGVSGQPQIFERAGERRQILLEAVKGDPALSGALRTAGGPREQNLRLDDWLRTIAQIKAHPISRAVLTDPFEELLLESYNAGLRASGAFDFDDLLTLAYRLLTEFPQVADLYRRIYGYICIDEAQDLNEAQYAVLQALCGEQFKNLMMVGDPKQSIFGFNTSSPKFMEAFERDFGAQRIELSENFRSSAAVVAAAQALEPDYRLEGQLPIAGVTEIVAAGDEAAEGILVGEEIARLISDGHPDIEGPVTPGRCAVLGRNRYVLLAAERELQTRSIACYRRIVATHEFESELGSDFQLALRVYANPADRFHLATIANGWGLSLRGDTSIGSTPALLSLLGQWAQDSQNDRSNAIAEALIAIDQVQTRSRRLDLMPGIKVLRQKADAMDADARRSIYNDTEVLRLEWDQYLHSGSASSRSIGGFLSQMALGTTAVNHPDSVALLTVHSAKGLEFDVVWIVGMADGIFPDYRARGNSRAQAEERRNAFVAVTRSRRLLYLSYPQTRVMPWGDIWNAQPSPYLHTIASHRTVDG